MSLDLPPVTPIWREKPPETPCVRPLSERARLGLVLVIPVLLIAAKLAFTVLLAVPEPYDVVAFPAAVLLPLLCIGAAIICGAIACSGDVPAWWGDDSPTTADDDCP